MAENDSQERTEEATPKRQQEAKEKGQVPRSRELTTALILITSAASFISFSPLIIDTFSNLAQRNLSLSRKDIFDNQVMMEALGLSLFNGFSAFFPVFLATLLVSMLGPVLLGGWTFNLGSAGPKGNRLSPLKGFKRMFGVNAIVELLKALGKFSVVAAVAIAYLMVSFDDFMSLGSGQLNTALAHGLNIVIFGFLLVSMSLILIAAIDVPYQMWNHSKQLKMTKQELKDEYKNTEGKPEVKGKIRRLAREFAERRMMEAVPKADVVITNPEHYAVAIRYDQKRDAAPIVVAKGIDLIAMQIRKVASHNDVPIIEAPPLARSIYHTTELDRQIPDGLYLAVAQLLAYVYQIRAYKKGKGKKPKPVKNYPIPDDMQYE